MRAIYGYTVAVGQYSKQSYVRSTLKGESPLLNSDQAGIILTDCYLAFKEKK